MATGNFKTMERFPLIVAMDEYTKTCPECGVTMGGDADKCDCGCDLTDVESRYDEFFMEDRYREMKAAADQMNEKQKFFEVTVESGYYSGLQFYVEDKYNDVENWDNDDAQYEFGCCRSEMLRRFKVAENTINRELEKAMKELGLIKLGVVARFSNGETIYTKVA